MEDNANEFKDSLLSMEETLKENQNAAQDDRRKSIVMTEDYEKRLST